MIRPPPYFKSVEDLPKQKLPTPFSPPPHPSQGQGLCPHPPAECRTVFRPSSLKYPVCADQLKQTWMMEEFSNCAEVSQPATDKTLLVDDRLIG